VKATPELACPAATVQAWTGQGGCADYRIALLDSKNGFSVSQCAPGRDGAMASGRLLLKWF